jgi:hypothetical protein
MTDKNTSYYTSSRDYAERAEKRLKENTIEGLFYTAFELRCGIEARLRQYIEVRDDISKKKKKGWQISKLANNLEKVYRTGDKIIEFRIFRPDTKDTLKTFYYTPVSKYLQKSVGNLGNILHAMKKSYSDNDIFWKDLRSMLTNILNELKVANYGNLLGPPTINIKSGRGRFYTEVDDRYNRKYEDAVVGSEGQIIMIEVKYLDDLPNYLLR